MNSFEYHAPRSLAEASAILARHNGEARALAGGTDLLLKMKADRQRPKAVVNLKRIPELRGLSFNGQLTIGALTTLEEIKQSTVIRERYPALAEAVDTMASVQVRNLATVGGNLCNAAPSADLPPILIALQAQAHIAGPEGERTLPLEAFFTGPGATVLGPGELLVGLRVPRPSGPALYLKHSPRAHMDIAVVGVGLALQMDGSRPSAARVVLGAVAPTPIRARAAEDELVGGELTAERLEKAAGQAAVEAAPIDDVRGSAWYRRRMVQVMVRRGLAALLSHGSPVS